MHDPATLARFAHVFPKYQHNPQWVRSFLEVFVRAGEDALAKCHQAFVNLSKDKRFTKIEREAARKFALSLSLLFDPPLSSTPQTDRLVRELFRRPG
jgi:hypothetical protein